MMVQRPDDGANDRCGRLITVPRVGDDGAGDDGANDLSGPADRGWARPSVLQF